MLIINQVTGLPDDVGDNGASAVRPLFYGNCQYVATQPILTADLSSSTLNGKADFAGNTPANGDRLLAPYSGMSALVGIYVFNGTSWALDSGFAVIEGARVKVIRSTGSPEWQQTAATGASAAMFAPAAVAPPGVQTAFVTTPEAISTVNASPARFDAATCLSSDSTPDNLYDDASLQVAGLAGSLTFTGGQIDPWGGSGAVKCASTGTNQNIAFTSPVSLVGGVGAYEFICYVKPVSITAFEIRLSFSGTWQRDIFFDLSTGQFTGGGSNIPETVYPDVFTSLLNIGGGWWKLIFSMVTANGNNDMTATFFASGNQTGKYFLAAGWKIARKRAIVTEHWEQTDPYKQPQLGTCYDKQGGQALNIEHAGHGVHLDGVAADGTFASGAQPFTLLWDGLISSEQSITAGDGVIASYDDGSGNYLRFGFRASGGVNYHWISQKVGGTTINALSPTAASHVPTVRAAVCNGTTVQWYADGLPDGSPIAFALGSFTPTTAQVGNISGDWYHQLWDLVPYRTALSASDVYAASDQLLRGKHGIPLGPWDLMHWTGQSNCYDRGTEFDLQQYLLSGQDIWSHVPFLDSSTSGGFVTTLSDSFYPLKTRPLQKPVIAATAVRGGGYGIMYSCARYLTERGRKIALTRVSLGGQTIAAWAYNGSQMYPGVLASAQHASALIAVPSRHWAMVIIQGEGDCGPGNTPSAYASNLANFIPHIRTDLSSPNMQVIQGRMSNNQWALAPYSTNAVNPGMDLYAASDPLYRSVSFDNLEFGNDGTHMTPRALFEAGLRVAKVAEML